MGEGGDRFRNLENYKLHNWPEASEKIAAE